MTSPDEQRAFAAFYERMRDRAARKCLIDSCSRAVISSHSVQNGVVLDALVERDHVFAFMSSVEGPQLKRLGRNRATTFNGFCGEHDNDLFKPIDFKSSEDFRSDDLTSSACFAMRALAREYWLKLNMIEVYREVIALSRSNRQDELQRLYGVTPDHAANMVANCEVVFEPTIQGSRLILGRLERSYKSLLAAMNQGAFQLWRFHSRAIHCRPAVAAASGFYPEFDFRGTRVSTRARHEDTPLLAVNVVALNDATWVLLAHHRRFERQLSGLVRDFESVPEDELRVLISKMLLTHCENTVLSPRYVEALRPADKQRLLVEFQRTMHDAVPYDALPSFDFFTKP